MIEAINSLAFSRSYSVHPESFSSTPGCTTTAITLSQASCKSLSKNAFSNVATVALKSSTFVTATPLSSLPTAPPGIGTSLPTI